jgi:hypothetical protein
VFCEKYCQNVKLWRSEINLINLVIRLRAVIRFLSKKPTGNTNMVRPTTPVIDTINNEFQTTCAFNLVVGLLATNGTGLCVVELHLMLESWKAGKLESWKAGNSVLDLTSIKTGIH